MEHKFGAKPIVFGALGLIVIASFYVIFTSLTSSQSRLVIGENSFNVYTALNETDRSKIFLSGSNAIDNDKLLMAFPSDGFHAISMKNIGKPIDIIWLDNNKKVIYIQTTTQSEVGRSIIYKPTSPSRFIIELPSGFVDGYMIKIGQIAEFDIKNEDVK